MIHKYDFNKIVQRHVAEVSESDFNLTENVNDIDLEELDETLDESEEAAHSAKELQEIHDAIENEYDEYVDHQTREAAQEVRNNRRASEIDSKGNLKGSWDGDDYRFNDDYIPNKKYNPDGENIAEISQKLNEKYGITLDSIPYRDGEADFSSISVAHLDAKDILLDRTELSEDQLNQFTEEEKVLLQSYIFSKEDRQINMDTADRIAAANHMEIPGLGTDYTADELEDWRSKNKFTWDEQVSNGYNLVPSVIHSSLGHTGLVGTMTNANITLREHRDHPEAYSFDDDDSTVISVSQLLKK